MSLENSLTGLKLLGPCQGLGPVESYCDDVNILTADDDDFAKINTEITNFERVSGAILSRKKKSKVMGFGTWRLRKDWPLQWLACETNIKVFGIYIADNYGEIMKINWNYRLQKF